MALLLPHSICLLTPKCGSQWISAAITKAKIPYDIIGGNENDTHSSRTHSDLKNTDLNNHFTFAFVRHPLSWYQSYWAYRMATGWTIESLDQKCESTSFHDFVTLCLKHFPGYVSNLYDHYVGDTPGRIHFVGRQENLVSDLINALHMAGECFDTDLIRQQEPINVRIHECSYTGELASAIIKSEERTMWRFGYIR